MAPQQEWVALLTTLLQQSEIIHVRAAIEDHLGRPVTSAEMVAARRAAHRLHLNGTARLSHSPDSGGDVQLGGSLRLTRTGATAAPAPLPPTSTTAAPSRPDLQQISRRQATRTNELVQQVRSLIRSIDAAAFNPSQARAAARQLTPALRELLLLRQQLCSKAGPPTDTTTADKTT